MVVAVGFTLIDPVPRVDVNVPGVIATLVTPVAVQLNVLLVPALTLVGFAANAVIVGIEPLPEDDELDELPPQAARPKQADRRTSARTLFFAACKRDKPGSVLQNE